MEDIYTSLEEAKFEIWRRWNDTELKKKIDKCLDSNIPSCFKKEPRAVLARDIATPDIEMFHFSTTCKKNNLNPLVLEYLKGIFFTMSADKVGLAKAHIFVGRDDSGNCIYKVRKNIDFKKYDKTRFCDIETIWGENLVHFHHRIFSEAGLDVETYDISSWYLSKGGESSVYYEKLLSLFVCNGILFENFVTDNKEREFADRVVYPAFKHVEKNIGVRPLIVQLVDDGTESDKYWWCYPRTIDKLMSDH